MAGQSQGVNMDQFDAYFQRADLDKDGKISGTEAVTFFQGFSLPKQVLAQIWMHADKGRTGFLGRAEFYDALKLVTVAQSKRELTPEIVKAALYGPAAIKIPAPKINLSNLSSSPSSQSNTLPPSIPAAQIGRVATSSSQNFSFGVQVPSSISNQQHIPAYHNQTTRPPLASTTGNMSHFQLGASAGFSRPGNLTIPGPQNPAASPVSLGGRTGTTPLGVTSFNTGLDQPSSLAASEPPSRIHQLSIQGSMPLSDSGNSIMSTLAFGGSLSSVKSSSPVQLGLFGASHGVSSSHSSVKSGAFDSLQSVLTMQTSSSQHSQSTVVTHAKQQVFTVNPSPLTSSMPPAGVAYPAAGQSHTWPRFEASNIQKYTKVFLEVDTDRDGRITGEQSRNLFFSWRLPREVLKQVWDLSDQDNDSMLSLKEFCVALYLMERYREGRPLPSVLPNNILFDETLVAMTSISGTSHTNATLGASYGQGLQQGLLSSQQMAPAMGSKPSVIPYSSHSDSVLQGYKQNSEILHVENSTRNRTNSQNAILHEAANAQTQAEGVGSQIMDSKEKFEFYRTKMQELVLYRSRCDNRLNEITERASADKHEVDSLTKKYEEKYKQVADLAAKLAVEEARFRDIQERKMELRQAISKMEQGGSADGILQVRADRIQSDLEELMKKLSECCKKHGLDVKSTDIIELPPGWKSGVEECAMEWDEEWDKFEDEGFSTAEANSISITKPASLVGQESSSSKVIPIPEDSPWSPISNSASTADDIPERLKMTGESVHEADPADVQSEFDFVRSSPGSPDGKFDDASPQRLFDIRSSKSNEMDSEIHRSFDEPGWGTFDNNDDVESIWGFNSGNSKEMGVERSRESYFFESPSADSVSRRRSIFADSVPGTPRSMFGNSPRYSEVSGDHFFDNLSRFDSFATRDGGMPSSFARFDSVSSSRDFGAGQGFISFDEADPFGSTAPFKVGQSPRK